MDNLHLYHELEGLLRNDRKYCMEDGTLIKNKGNYIPVVHNMNIQNHS